MTVEAQNPAAPVFPEFCRPWLDAAATRLPGEWERHPELAEALTGQLSAVAARVLAAELGAWRDAALLNGATPEERWADFSGRVLVRPEMQTRLRSAYPLLFVLLDRVTEYFCGNLVEALARLREREGRREIRRIETGLSDPHAGGRTVIRFEFEDGGKLIYKPRNVRGEAWWADFVAWWNASGVSAEMRLRAPAASDHGEYGWCEFIEQADGLDETEESVWFFRQGVQVAITWLFGIEDCHFGNFITAGAQPVLVDAECVAAAFWRPRTPEVPKDLPWMFTPAWKTALAGGMLPAWMMPKVPDQPLYVAPGIAGTGDRPLPVKRPRWRGVGTDELKLELVAGIVLPERGRTNTATSPDEVAAGFRGAMEHLLARREEVLSWVGSGDPLDPLRVRPRMLLRNTAGYQQILEAASGPKYLASPEARQTALRTVATLPVIGGEEPEGLFAAELPYLEGQIYPRFVINAEGTGVVPDDGGTAVLAGDIKTAEANLRTRWQELESGGIRWQVEIVAAACRQAGERRPGFPKGENPYLQAAREIGEAMERQAMRRPEGAAWLGLETDREGRVAVGIPRGDFHTGAAGGAVFLSQLAKATGERRFQDLAEEALRFSDLYWTRAATLGGPVPWSAYHGAGSILAAVGWGEGLKENGSGQEIAARWLERANQDRSWLELNGDHLAGLPGLTVAFASLVELPLARDLTRQALDRLLDPAMPGALTMPGLAHGTAGWVVAVAAAAQALDDERARRVARDMIATLPGQWEEFEKRPSVQKDPPTGWCNGAIGLMAAAAEHADTAGEARGFLEKARPYFGSGRGGHHVCCGEAGRVLLLTRTAKLLDSPELLGDARKCADGMLDHAREKGFLVFQSVPERLTVPGWMSGMAGVGSAWLTIHTATGAAGKKRA